MINHTINPMATNSPTTRMTTLPSRSLTLGEACSTAVIVFDARNVGVADGTRVSRVTSVGLGNTVGVGGAVAAGGLNVSKYTKAIRGISGLAGVIII